MLGVASALVPLVAALASLSDRLDARKALVALVVVLVLAATIAGFGYSQTNSWNTAARWFIRALVEALVVALSLVALRRLGYHLTALPRVASLAPGDSPFSPR
jgi:hypothetical protein